MPRKMKESGVEWLGQIPEGWGKIRLRFVADVTTGDKDTQDANPDGNYPFYVRSPVVERASDYTFEGDDILMAGDGAGAGRIFHMAHGRYAVHQRVYRFYGFRSIGQKLLWYYLSSTFPIIMDQGSAQSTVPSVRLPMLLNHVIAIPPCSEQQRIAAFLDGRCAKIDGMIAEAKASIEDYKKWKQSIIFEAVTGKHEKNLKPSGVDWIGDVPEGWKVCKVLHVLSMPITDGPHTTPELYDDGIPFVSAEAVSAGNGHIDFNHIRGYISEAFYRECSEKYVPELDDIYMIKSGATTGKVAIVDTDRIFTIWSPLAVFRCDKDKSYPKFLFYFLQSPVFQKQVELAWSFGTQQNIGMRMLEGLKIVRPPLIDQRRIAAELDEKCAAIDKLVGEKESLIADLEAYKKSLIFETVTGKREVA